MSRLQSPLRPCPLRHVQQGVMLPPRLRLEGSQMHSSLRVSPPSLTSPSHFETASLPPRPRYTHLSPTRNTEKITSTNALPVRGRETIHALAVHIPLRLAFWLGRPPTRVQ
ncbi:hypothetical protein LZ31DRAFT_330794 [Colletotrichum somersetense]|nr:hypothetical protein LZ31DRAFT_330794 [Colletotrichum somersetense]